MAALLERAASRRLYQRWLGTACRGQTASGPIRLHGQVRDVDTATGEILRGLRHRRRACPTRRSTLPAATAAPRSARRAPRLTAPTPTSLVQARAWQARQVVLSPGIRRHPPLRVRHLHRPLFRARPHPRGYQRRQGCPLPSPPQGGPLPAWSADVLSAAPPRRRCVPGPADLR